jgi:hypothetical protein
MAGLKNNNVTLNNITVIIRTANERTIKVCKEIVLKEVNEKNIFVVAEKPFSEAVKKTFEIGIAEGKKWTLAVDADLILMPNSIVEMIKNADMLDDRLYVYQGHILDKFRCGIKQGGPHLYLTQNLDVVKKFYGEISLSLRPESFTYKKMEALGYKVVSENRLFALHDFYQSNSDIYRKAFFHGIKHPNWKSLLPTWVENGKTDMDFKIAVHGFIDGYYSNLEEYPSVSFLKEMYGRSAETYIFLEPEEELNVITTHDIDRILESHRIELKEGLGFSTYDKSVSKKGLKKFIRKIYRNK